MYRFAKNLLLPPAFPFCVVFIGVALTLVRADASGVVLFSGVGLLYLSSLPFVGSNLLALLAGLAPAPNAPEGQSVQAIVVLSGDLKRAPAALSPDGAGKDLGSLSTARVRHAARLHRRTGLPILVSGGASTVMAAVLSEEFGITAVWIEDESRRTAENALCSAALLHAQGIQIAYLVTQDWHLPRAFRAFRKTALTVIPAPASHSSAVQISIAALVPSAAGVTACHFAVYELLGLLQQGLSRR